MPWEPDRKYYGSVAIWPHPMTPMGTGRNGKTGPSLPPSASQILKSYRDLIDLTDDKTALEEIGLQLARDHRITWEEATLPFVLTMKKWSVIVRTDARKMREEEAA